MSATCREEMTMPGTRHDTETEVVEVSHTDGAKMLDKAARQKLNISGEEFLARWDRGFYEDADDPSVTEVAMLIPFAR